MGKKEKEDEQPARSGCPRSGPADREFMLLPVGGSARTNAHQHGMGEADGSFAALVSGLVLKSPTRSEGLVALMT